MPPRSVLRLILQPIAIAIALALVVRSAVKIYAIPSASMEPTLEVGDHIIVTPYLFGEPERGHVVVFRSGEETLVKRIVGVPGDILDTRLGKTRVDGHTLAEPYVLRPASTGAIESVIIARDSFFVMGDNRDDSLDSRSSGPIPRGRIVGRARLILWSSTDAVRRAQRLFKWIE
jgi:signal peptidase I